MKRRAHQTMEGRAAIVRRRAAGEAYASLGAEFQISVTRVRQSHQYGLWFLDMVLINAGFGGGSYLRNEVQKLYFGPADMRIQNCLQNDNITTIRQLADISDEELCRFPNFGQKCLKELRAVVPKAA